MPMFLHYTIIVFSYNLSHMASYNSYATYIYVCYTFMWFGIISSSVYLWKEATYKYNLQFR